MGVYVKGMEIPKKCLWCPLQYIGFCQVTKTDVNSDLGRRADDCPLVEVPEPHGQLIDADKLIIDLIDRGLEGIQTDDYSEIQQTIIVQDTVIEAEDE